MKFVCDRCQTRYSISDEKVRGKVLKIRCKTCSNIIVVRESMAKAQAAARAAQGGGSARGPAPTTDLDLPRADAPFAADDNIEWWVAIKGEQKGPMKRSEIERLFYEGQISARSYCWHENMSGWTRLRDLPDFAHLVNEGSVPKRPAPPPPPPDDGGAEVVDLLKARAQREAQQQPTAPAASFDPFAAVSPGPAGDNMPRPGEATRVFIMNAGLAGRERKHKTYAAVAGIVVVAVVGLLFADWRGWIKIPWVHDAITFYAESAGVERPRKKADWLASWDEVDDINEAELRCLLGKVDCPVEEKKRILAKREKKVGGDVLAGLDLDGVFGGTDGASGSALARRTGEGGGLAEIGDPFNSDEEKAKEIASVFAKDKKRVLKPTAKIETPSVSSGSGLDAEQISKVIGSNMSAVKSCVETAAKNGSMVDGKQYLVLTIVPNGLVKQARFKDAVTNAQPVGECITKRAKKWKFPPFAGEAFDVEIPLILSTGF